jgi:L-cystine uptake protein TcyP (sodium:dicarboxylate symporter family)
MQIFIILLALFVSTAIGAVIGFVVASRWQFNLTISRKEDYEQKLAELEKIIDNMVATSEPEPGPEYSAFDMFPPNLDPEYGLPRTLKR